MSSLISVLREGYEEGEVCRRTENRVHTSEMGQYITGEEKAEQGPGRVPYNSRVRGRNGRERIS